MTLRWFAITLAMTVFFFGGFPTFGQLASNPPPLEYVAIFMLGMSFFTTMIYPLTMHWHLSSTFIPSEYAVIIGGSASVIGLDVPESLAGFKLAALIMSAAALNMARGQQRHLREHLTVRPRWFYTLLALEAAAIAGSNALPHPIARSAVYWSGIITFAVIAVLAKPSHAQHPVAEDQAA